LSNAPALSGSNITFNGSQWFTTPVSSAPTTESLFIVLNTTSNYTTDIFSGTAVGYREVLLYLSNLYVGRFGAAPAGTNGGPIATNTRLQFNYQYTTTNVTYSVNGTQTGSGTPGFTYSGTNTTYIGSSTYSPNNYVGTINEIVYYTAALTTAQRQQIEGYLARKWGISSNLPTTHLYRSIPIVTRAFQPIDIPNCALWLDAADAATLTLSGSNVTQWNDKSGNGQNVTQGTPSLQPTYSSASNAIVFNATGYLSIPNALSLITPTYTIFVVDKRATSNVAFFIGQHTVSTGNTAIILGYNGTATSHHTTAYVTDLQVTIPAYQGASEPRRMHRFGYTGTTRNTLINGGEYIGSQSFSNTLPVWSNANIGAGYWTPGQLGQTWWYAGNIHEVLFFNRVLTTTESQQIEGYLAAKWGLRTNLPSTHPFKLVPAVTPVFTPLQISGCQLWLDAADRTTLFTDTAGTTNATSGQTIARWNDKSGNGNYLLQSTSSNRPTLSSFANTPAVYFATNGLSLTSVSNSATTGNSARTMFLLQYAPTTTSITRVGTGTHSAGSPPTAFGFDNNTTGSTAVLTPYVYTSADVIRYVSLRTLSLLYAYYDPTSSTIGGGYSFGNVLTSSTTLNTGATPWYFGQRPDTFGCVESYICEFLHFNSFLSTAQRQQVEGYLAAKWGLKSSLPSTHPFKVITP
jgi:hypothetical protein